MIFKKLDTTVLIGLYDVFEDYRKKHLIDLIDKELTHRGLNHKINKVWYNRAYTKAQETKTIEISRLFGLPNVTAVFFRTRWREKSLYEKD